MQRSVLHIYQRSVSGFLLFYTVTDFLVFFTVFCVTARRHRVRILGVCPMFDHVHILVEGAARKEATRFVQACFSSYAKELNQSLGTSGAIFRRDFGCAVKTGDKAIRTACSYLYNNPGEKNLCKRAEDYRWTFMAYAVSRNPFSEPLKLSRATLKLRKILKMADYLCSRDHYLRHVWLEKWFRDLSPGECQQLTDYIISSYNCIDYNKLLHYYGDSYEMMSLAFASNQGSEYDIKEDTVRESHRPYLEIPSRIRSLYGESDIKKLLRLDENAKRDIFTALIPHVHATKRQLAKYLRL